MAEVEEHCRCCDPPHGVVAPKITDYLDVFYYGGDGQNWARRLRPGGWDKITSTRFCCNVCVTGDAVWAIARAEHPTIQGRPWHKVPNFVKFSLSGERLVEKWFPFGVVNQGSATTPVYNQFAGSILLACPDGGVLAVGWMMELDNNDMPVAAGGGTRNLCKFDSDGNAEWYKYGFIGHRVITGSPDGLAVWNMESLIGAGGFANLTLADQVMNAPWVQDGIDDWSQRSLNATGRVLPSASGASSVFGIGGMQDNGDHIVTFNGQSFARWNYDRFDWWRIGLPAFFSTVLWTIDGHQFTIDRGIGTWWNVDVLNGLTAAGYPATGITLNGVTQLYEEHDADWYQANAGQPYQFIRFAGQHHKTMSWRISTQDAIIVTGARILNLTHVVAMSGLESQTGPNPRASSLWFADGDRVFFQNEFDWKVYGLTWDDADIGTASIDFVGDSVGSRLAPYKTGDGGVAGFCMTRQPAHFYIEPDTGTNEWTGGTFRLKYRDSESRRRVSYVIRAGGGFPGPTRYVDIVLAEMLTAAWCMSEMNDGCGQRFGLHASTTSTPSGFTEYYSAHARSSDDFGPSNFELIDHQPDGDPDATLKITWRKVGTRELNWAKWGAGGGPIEESRCAAEDFGIHNHFSFGPLATQPNYGTPTVDGFSRIYLDSVAPDVDFTMWKYGWIGGGDIFGINSGSGSQQVPWAANGGAAANVTGMPISASSVWTEDALRW
jgi:hypothetical protein